MAVYRSAFSSQEGHGAFFFIAQLIYLSDVGHMHMQQGYRFAEYLENKGVARFVKLPY